jgi:hypothetical protein
MTQALGRVEGTPVGLGDPKPDARGSFARWPTETKSVRR